METRAKCRFARVAPRKARAVCDLIRGKQVDEALNVLEFTNKKAARLVKQVLDSAIANAMEKPGTNVDLLRVKSVEVGQGPTIKRFRPRAQGRATRIRKMTSHITIVLDDAI